MELKSKAIEHEFDVKVARKRDFAAIRKSVKDATKHEEGNAVAILGDSLEVLKRLPDESVSLILTDPPYHATKKRNIVGDTSFEKDQHYLEWLELYAAEWRRILKINGSLFCFCDSSMASRIDVMLSKTFNVLSHVVWTKPNDPGFDGWKGKMKKESLRQWYPHSERVLFAEPAVEGNLFRSTLAAILSNARRQAGMSMHELTAIIGAHGKVNHGGAVSNWEAGRNTPSKDQYEKMRTALLATGKVDPLPHYEDAVRVFRTDATKQFTDVWDFPSVRPYKGKHPAEKPLGLLEHAIETTTNEGDVVLDCFAGSGSTAIAALNLRRRAVAIEIDEKWYEVICTRLAAAGKTKERTAIGPIKKDTGQLALFFG